jgi:predicted phosphodiesterase
MEYYERAFSQNEVHIYVLGDWHYGSPRCDEKLLYKFLKIIEKDKFGYWIAVGDLHENNLESSIGSSYEQIMNPEEQIYGKYDINGKMRRPGLLKILEPIANKGLFFIEGNHGYRTTKVSGLVPDRIIADKLGVAFKGIGCIGKFIVKSKSTTCNRTYKFLAHHGFGGGRTIGGKINCAMRIRDLAPTVDLTISGHTHMISRTPRVWFDMLQGGVGRQKITPLYEGYGWDYVCGSLLTYSGSYAERRVMPPAVKGQIMITLLPARPNKKQLFEVID